MQNYAESFLGYREKVTVVPCIDYELTTPAAVMPVSLAELKANARLDASDTSEDTYLTLLINSVTMHAEDIMRRDIINKTYTGRMDYFPTDGSSPIEIRKSRLQSITSIKYYVDGVLQTFSSAKYYITKEADYGSIYLTEGESWPSDADSRKQAVEIIFVAGFGAAAVNVSDEIRLALLQHATFMYQSRGDACDGGCSKFMPDTSKETYLANKLYSLCEGC